MTDLEDAQRQDAEYLQFHDARLGTIRRQLAECWVKVEACMLYVRNREADETCYEVHPTLVEFHAVGVKAFFVDVDVRERAAVDEACFAVGVEELESLAVLSGRRFDELLLSMSDGRKVQVLAETIQMTVVSLGPATRRWLGALDDPKAREEWVEWVE